MHLIYILTTNLIHYQQKQINEFFFTMVLMLILNHYWLDSISVKRNSSKMNLNEIIIKCNFNVYK